MCAGGHTEAVQVAFDPKVVSYEALLAAVAREVEGVDGVWVSGVPVFQRETSAQTRSELLLFGPLVVLAIAVLLTVTFRSVRAAIGVLGTGVTATGLMLAVVGALGVLGPSCPKGPCRTWTHGLALFPSA